MLYDDWNIDCCEIVPIEYSGHGFRFKEPLADTMDELVCDIISQLKIDDADSDYLIFGHSMGGLLTWLVTNRIIRDAKKRPQKIILSAIEPPDLLDTNRYNRFRSDDEIVSFIKKYERLSEKRIHNSFFLQSMIPIIKNDYRLLSEYIYDDDGPLDIPVVCISSLEDSLMKHEKMGGWAKLARNVKFIDVNGDHFYIDDHKMMETLIVQEINK